MNNNQQSFNYTYSAKQQEEIQRIRSKYVPQEEDKLEQLRQLDRSVTKNASIVSLIFGIAGTLIFGLGLTCILEFELYGISIIISIIGIAVLSLAYPLYSIISNRKRKKLTPEIIRLTDELMK